MKQRAVVETIILYPLQDIPLIRSGDDLCTIIIESVESNKFQFSDGDILVIAQKIVSKSEGRLVNLKQIQPSKRSIKLASRTKKDPRLVELILSESKKVIRFKKGLIVVQNHQGVIINDSIGRAWRNGTIGTAIGVAGLPAILDLKGREDLFGNPLKVSEQAIADELASAASLIQGQADEALPLVLIKGFKTLFDNIPASGLIRDIKKDLFL